MLCSMLIEWPPRPDVVVEVPADHQQGLHVVLLDVRPTHQVLLESRKEGADLLTVVREGLDRQRKHRIQVDGLQPFAISKVLDAEGCPTLPEVVQQSQHAGLQADVARSAVVLDMTAQVPWAKPHESKRVHNHVVVRSVHQHAVLHAGPALETVGLSGVQQHAAVIFNLLLDRNEHVSGQRPVLLAGQHAD